MDTLQDLMMGFSIALSPDNLVFALIGCLVGTAVGVLPGLGPVAATAMLIPLTFQLPATGAIIMLAAIYYGSQYGGTITSVLMNVPGEGSTVVTCIDGYQMTKQGRAGAALCIAAIGSFIGGTVAVIALVIAAPLLTRWGLQFGPVEFFALLVFGLSLVTGLASASMVKSLIMALSGLALAIIGMDPAMGVPRFTFGSMELMEGISFVAVIMGLFGVGEVLINVEKTLQAKVVHKISSLIPSRRDLVDSAWPIARGTAVGLGLGLVPGMTNAASSFLSYAVEKKASRHPERFGTGAIEGVAGPETANNAHANGAMIPLFTLGIPASPTMAVLMGAFMMNGLTPGPFLFRDHPDVAWGVIASMYIGNIILVALNLPLIGMWVRILTIPYSVLFAIIVAMMLVGAYSVDSSSFNILVMALFGLIGYILKKLDFPLAPGVLTLILGPMTENALRRSLELSEGSLAIFMEGPVVPILLIAAAVVLLSPVLRLLFAKCFARRGDARAKPANSG